MRFGINTFLLTSPFTNTSTGLFRKIKGWGFESVELPIEDPKHIDPRKIKRDLDKSGLVCGSVCACMGPDRDLRGTPRQQKIGMTYLKQLIDEMVLLDCPSLIGPVYSATGRADAVPPKEYKKQWRTVAGHLEDLCNYAEQRGKQVCLEPLNRFETDFINTCDQALKMVKDVGSPALKIQALKDIHYEGDIVIESFATHVKLIARAAEIWRQIEPNQEDIATKGLKFLQRIL